MTFKTNRTAILTTMVLLVATMLFAGCSRSPVSPDNTATQPQVLQRTTAPEGVAFSPVDLYKEVVFNPDEGGTLVLLDVVLEVPPGAVTSPEVFSIFIPDDEIFYNEFGTDGLVFDTPVTVTMSYRNADLSGVDESTIRIGFYNDRTGEWENTDCKLDKVNKTGVIDDFNTIN